MSFDNERIFIISLFDFVRFLLCLDTVVVIQVVILIQDEKVVAEIIMIIAGSFISTLY